MSLVLGAAIAALIAGAAAARAADAAKTCRSELGPSAAAALVRDCRDVDPVTPALCRPETPCKAMREMIATACRSPTEAARAACRQHREDEDEDEDE